ncbi:SDR family oxidoreductase [Photobacterium phosphoreum]|uniref:SDR family oxidoreductase n=1 Tax=Photobacterium phosphoreum TaxID=659 RepID=UPI0007F94465|nr:SDR family oxidoreductase [Photobacterium phosphoreum]OBU47347.1 SDR family oxidoreductase [Photobacterium phosphoreum]
MKALVVGGSGGIGLAVIKQLLHLKPHSQIHATYFRHQPDYHHPQLHWHQIDITVETDIAKLAAQLIQLDIVINAVGMLHTAEHLPEKSIQHFDVDFFQTNIQTNTLPTLLLAKHFMSPLKTSRRSYFVTVSAKVGSIEDNKLGGWISYRSSKAALNMAIKTISIEWRTKLPHCCVLAFHPGTTASSLSKPFQRNVALHKLFTPEYTAQCLLNLLATLTPQNTGKFLSYDGSTIPW